MSERAADEFPPEIISDVDLVATDPYVQQVATRLVFSDLPGHEIGREHRESDPFPKWHDRLKGHVASKYHELPAGGTGKLVVSMGIARAFRLAEERKLKYLATEASNEAQASGE